MAAFQGTALAQPSTPSTPSTPSAPSAPTAPTPPAPAEPSDTKSVDKTKASQPAIPDVFLPPRERYKTFFGGYPLELVDRPLVGPSGMTEFSPSYQLRTHVESGLRTGFADDQTLDLELTHVFGPVNVGFEIGFGTVIAAFGAIALPSLPLALSVGLNKSDRQVKDAYGYGQYLRLDYKQALVPHRFALLASATTSISEVRFHDAVGMAIEGVEIDGSGGALGEFQLTRNWCVFAGFSGAVPLHAPAAFASRSTLGANVSVNFAVWKWDFFVNGILGDITRGHPSTLLNIGFTRRWGI